MIPEPQNQNEADKVAALPTSNFVPSNPCKEIRTVKVLHPPKATRNVDYSNKKGTPGNSAKPPAAKSVILAEPVTIRHRNNIWRLTYEVYEGRPRVNWRKWFFTPDGELCATREGVILNQDQLRNLGTSCFDLADMIANDTGEA